MAGVSQLGDYIRGLQHPCSVGCVFSGSQHHQLALCVFCWGENLSWVCLRFLSFGQFLYILFSPWSVTPTSPWVFGSNVFCSSIILIEASGCGLYSQHHLLHTKGQVCLDPFVICSVLCKVPNLQPLSFRFCFLGKLIIINNWTFGHYPCVTLMHSLFLEEDCLSVAEVRITVLLFCSQCLFKMSKLP